MVSGSRSATNRVGTPRISVVLATYNGAEFIDEQLQSLASQTRLPDELVVVDDASTDDTPDRLRGFQRRANFPVRLTFEDHHRGTCATFESALRQAGGDIHLICDQDDVWIPEKVAVLADRMTCRPDALLAFSDAVLIGAHGQRISRSRWRVAGFGPRQQAALERDPFGVMMGRQVVSGCTAAIRAELVPAVLPFPSDVHPALGDMMYDRWISLVAAAAGPVMTVPERLVAYRIHQGQQIGIPALALRRFAPQLALRAGQFVPGRLEKAERADYHRAHLHEIHKRMTAADTDTGDSGIRLRLAAEHLQARTALSAARRRRLSSVARHYVDEDGYRRFALGLSTALSDWSR